MKIGHIVCFIFSVIGLLALVAYFFPQEGVAIGGMQLRFPTLAEVLQAGEEEIPTDTIPEDTLTTEELMQLRMDALKAEKESEFITYCQTSPARIYMPGDSVAYFDPFFDALETARERPMRIMHYGDSQLEGDRITSVLREADYDVQIHNFAEKSFCEQVRIMQTSKVIISNHGAQLVNLLFLQPGSAVIELFNPFFILDMYREMAKRAEIRYVAIANATIVNLPSEKSRSWWFHPYAHCDVEMDATVLLHAVQSLAGSRQLS